MKILLEIEKSKEKDWDTADFIRDQLNEININKRH